MIAFTWFAVTTMGNAFIVVFPWMTWTETPAKVGETGKLLTWAKVAGPSRCPKIENIDPWAIEPPLSPGGVKLAAFTTPR